LIKGQESQYPNGEKIVLLLWFFQRNNNADHLRHRGTYGNGSASSDGEDDHQSMRPPARKLLKSNGLQVRNVENKQEVNFISWAALIVQLAILCYMCSEEVNRG
jgi:hypothetical protein